MIRIILWSLDSAWEGDTISSTIQHAEQGHGRSHDCHVPGLASANFDFCTCFLYAVYTIERVVDYLTCFLLLYRGVAGKQGSSHRGLHRWKHDLALGEGVLGVINEEFRQLAVLVREQTACEHQLTGRHNVSYHL